MSFFNKVAAIEEENRFLNQIIESALKQKINTPKLHVQEDSDVYK
jgi:hypothetical protein